MSKPLFHRLLRRCSAIHMDNARRVRAKRRATRVTQTAHVGNGVPRRSTSQVANAAIDPAAREQQDS